MQVHPIIRVLNDTLDSDRLAFAIFFIAHSHTSECQKIKFHSKIKLKKEMNYLYSKILRLCH